MAMISCWEWFGNKMVCSSLNKRNILIPGIYFQFPTSATTTKCSMMKALPKFPPRESHVAWQSLPRKRSCGCPHNLPTLCHLWTSLRFGKKGMKKGIHKNVMPCSCSCVSFEIVSVYMGKRPFLLSVWLPRIDFFKSCRKENTKFYVYQQGKS